MPNALVSRLKKATMSLGVFIGENMIYIKKPTTYEEQIEIIKKRGCIITDCERAKTMLEAIGYYRLSGYFLPFRSGDCFEVGTDFERIINIYEFDSTLRTVLLGCIEEIEVFLRSNFSYYFAHKYGSLGYQNPNNFSDKHKADKFESTYKKEIQNNNSSLFVKHHNQKYNGHFPIWVLMEIFTFGMTSYFYSDLKTADQKVLAHSLYNTVPKSLCSWLRCCTDIRNICAHYGRLYYRVFSATPNIPSLSEREKVRLWGAIMTIKSLYPFKDRWNDEITSSLVKLFNYYKNDISLYHIAFPRDWKEKIRK